MTDVYVAAIVCDIGVRVLGAYSTCGAAMQACVAHTPPTTEIVYEVTRGRIDSPLTQPAARCEYHENSDRWMWTQFQTSDHYGRIEGETMTFPPTGVQLQET